jgi:hypothetical protein
MSEIKRLRITIEPDHLEGLGTSFKVEIDRFGHETISRRDVVPNDSFLSLFDRLFDRAREEIRRHIKAEK